MRIDINVRSGQTSRIKNTAAAVKQITDFITTKMRLKIVRVKEYNDRLEDLHTFVIADEL